VNLFDIARIYSGKEKPIGPQPGTTSKRSTIPVYTSLPLLYQLSHMQACHAIGVRLSAPNYNKGEKLTAESAESAEFVFLSAISAASAVQFTGDPVWL
jgi:hypothetical protein